MVVCVAYYMVAAGFLFVMKKGTIDPRKKEKPKSLPVFSLHASALFALVKKTTDTLTSFGVLKKSEADDDWEEVCMQARVDDVFSLLSSVLF